MEKTFETIEHLTAQIKEYADNHIASVKLSAAEKSSKVIASIIAIMIVILVLFGFVLFASIALAYAFAKLTGEFYWGFLIVAFIYLIIGSIIWAKRERFLRLPIMNAMLKQLFESDNDEKN